MAEPYTTEIRTKSSPPDFWFPVIIIKLISDSYISRQYLFVQGSMLSKS